MASVEFFGQRFGLREQVSEWALMEFAEAAADGVDKGSALAGMAAMLRLVKECVLEEDVDRFVRLARKRRAGSDDLIPILTATFGDATERPTLQPSDSSDGLSPTVASSVVSSADKGSVLFRGRPDLQLAVRHTRSA